MKNFSFLLLIFSLLLYSANAQEQTVDQVLSKYFKSNGYDKLQKVKTIIMTGHITRQDYMPLKIIRMRPDKYRMESDEFDMTSYHVYDGKTAWMTTPWTGNSKPQVMPENAAKNFKARADFDGAIYNWKEKGHLAELIGKEKVNDLETYKIKLTMNDGVIEYYFIDTKDYLLQKKLSSKMVRGKEMEIASTFSDYREIDGIKFPFKNDNFMGGRPYSTIEYDKITLNEQVNESIFSMPK
jgi:outer membrane lipoprotein-sorting protein